MLTILSCGSKKNELKTLADSNKDDLRRFCDDFLKQSEIRNICIASSYDKNQCDAINSWVLCSKKWKTWSEQKTSFNFLNNLDEVLTDQKIDKVKYVRFADMLKKYNLKAIKKVFDCQTCVDLEYDVDGLRYSQNNKYTLKEDHEYLVVEKLNPNWTFYHRDWN